MRSYVKYLFVVLLFLGPLWLSGCIGSKASPAAQFIEKQKDTVSFEEIIHINNCGGKGNSEQTASRTFGISVDLGGKISAGYEDIVTGELSAKYSEFRNVAKSQHLVAPPGTNMEFVLRWYEDVRAGKVSVNGEEGEYEVRIPISVEQVSSRDLGCTTSTPAPSPSRTPTLTPTSVPTKTATPLLGCPGWDSLLHANQKAHISSTPSLANNVRSAPGLGGNIIGQAPPGATVRVLRGPKCANGYYWWQIEVLSSGLIGWTAEGDKTGAEQWIIPDEP